MPFGNANAAGMGAGVPTAMPGKPGMTGAPAGPEAMPGGGGAQPNPLGAQFPPPMQAPLQPTAGGPTSPMNIQAMLKAKLADLPAGGAGGGMGGPTPGGPTAPAAQAPVRVPLPQWGDSAGSPMHDPTGGSGTGMGTGMGMPPEGGAAPDPQGGGDGGGGGATGAPSLIMLRLMRAMGQLPGSQR